MKIAVRFTDGTKNLLDDHADNDNTVDLADPKYTTEYIEYIEKMLKKKVSVALFGVVVVAEPTYA